MKKSALIALIGVGVLIVTQIIFLAQELMLPEYKMSWTSVFLYFFQIVGLIMIGIYLLSAYTGSDVADGVLGNQTPNANRPRQQQPATGYQPNNGYQPGNGYQPNNGFQPGNGYQPDSKTIISKRK